MYMQFKKKKTPRDIKLFRIYLTKKKRKKYKCALNHKSAKMLNDTLESGILKSCKFSHRTKRTYIYAYIQGIRERYSK